LFVFIKYRIQRIKYICAFYFNFFVFLDVLFRIFDVTLQWRQNMCHVISHEGKYCTFNKNIREKKNQTPVRGQDGKISDTRGKDFYWSSTRTSLVGDQKSFPWVSNIFPSCPPTGVRSFISRHFLLKYLY
jgi:hypothetical protein